MKKYKKLTQNQIDIMKIYWWFMQRELTSFYKKVDELQNDMAKHTKIKDIEFISASEEPFIGIGNFSRTIQLYQRDELEA